MTIPFVDLQAQRERIADRLGGAIKRVLEHGQFILGPEVYELETQLADFAGVEHAVTCSSGTDALLLALMVNRVGPGDAVFVPSFTFAATAEVVALLGATPVFVDVRSDIYNMDPMSLARGVDHVVAEGGLTPRAVIAVDLFGHPADYPAIESIANDHGMFVLADAAQSFGATRGGKSAVGCCDIAATSFFPAKPLGCYGDGGAVFTRDESVAGALRSLRAHGEGAGKYDHVRIGTNSRLDTIQAAVLLEKLRIFPDELQNRQRIAERYGKGLGDLVQVPTVTDGVTSSWAMYTLLLEDRDAVAASLNAKGVPTAVHYPKPLHQQEAYGHYPVPDGAPVAVELASRVLSLPIHPYLEASTQDEIIVAVRSALSVATAD